MFWKRGEVIQTKVRLSLLKLMENRTIRSHRSPADPEICLNWISHLEITLLLMSILLVYTIRMQSITIQKENIGLIEVMGLAVLPARLKEELELLGRIYSGGKRHFFQ